LVGSRASHWRRLPGFRLYASRCIAWAYCPSFLPYCNRHPPDPGRRRNCLVQRSRLGAMAPLQAGSGAPNGNPTRRGEKVPAVPRGHRRRWDLWTVGLWLSILSRFQGVRQVRVPSKRRAVPVGLHLERYVTARRHAHSACPRCLWRTTLWEIQWGQ
jgi:hypothetical protein